MRGKGDGYDWYKGALERYGKFPDAVAAWEELKRRAFPDRRKHYWMVNVRRGSYRKYRAGAVVALHRLVKAYELGRLLRHGEIVHHRDGDPANNHPRNLELCGNQGEHMAAHGHVGWFSRGRGLGAYDRVSKKIVRVARVVMELFLGRRLGSGEVVVHLNGDTRDNRPSNLRVMTRAEMGRIYGGKHGKGSGNNSSKCEGGFDRLRDGRAAGSVAGGADAHGAAHSDRARRRAA